MPKRFGVAHAFAGSGAVLSASLAWSACHSNSVPLPSSTEDAGSDTGDDGEASVEPPEGEACNPCIQVCPCTVGFTFYDPRTCTTYTCLDGAWGGVSCLGLGCDEAGDAGDGGDATLQEDADSSVVEAGDAPGAETGDSSPAPDALDTTDSSLPDAPPTDATSG
jgi:hypothetical protein